jgi:hypothetical protein
MFAQESADADALRGVSAVHASFIAFGGERLLLAQQELRALHPRALVPCTSHTFFVSYCWRRSWHPDADGSVMERLRAHAKKLPPKQRSKSSYWIDYCCLPQKYFRLGLSQNDFKAVLQSMEKLLAGDAKVFQDFIQQRSSFASVHPPLHVPVSEKDKKPDPQDAAKGCAALCGVCAPLRCLDCASSDPQQDLAVSIDDVIRSVLQNRSDLEDEYFRNQGLPNIDSIILRTRFLALPCASYGQRSWPVYEISVKISQIFINAALMAASVLVALGISVWWIHANELASDDEVHWLEIGIVVGLAFAFLVLQTWALVRFKTLWLGMQFDASVGKCHAWCSSAALWLLALKPFTCTRVTNASDRNELINRYWLRIFKSFCVIALGLVCAPVGFLLSATDWLLSLGNTAKFRSLNSARRAAGIKLPDSPTLPAIELVQVRVAVVPADAAASEQTAPAADTRPQWAKQDDALAPRAADAPPCFLQTISNLRDAYANRLLAF